MNSPSFPIDKGKFFLQLGDDLHSFLGIKTAEKTCIPSRSEFKLVTKQPVHPIHGLNHRGILIVTINVASVDDG